MSTASITRPGLPVALGGAVAAAALGATARKLVHDRAARREAEKRAFRLGEDEGGPEGTRRVATGQIDNAMDRLDAARGDELGEAIHDARKAFKRARAAIRLGRDAFGKNAYARENAALRDAGRALAEARDADAVVETLDALVERYREHLPPQAFAGLRAALTAEAQATLERARSNPASLHAVTAELGAVRGRIASWPLDGAAGDEALTAGFRRIYRRGRRALRKADEHPGDEALHELRKRSKELWHAAQIMRPAGPKRMKKVARRAHKLANAAGDHHDLGVLRNAAAERDHTLRPGESLLLRALVRDRQDDLRREALQRGRRVYAKKRPRVAAR